MKRRKLKMTKSRKERLKQIGKWALLLGLSYEAFIQLVYRKQHRRDVFNLALQKQAATSKKLVVVGNPDGDPISRLLGKDFDCADICISVSGCPSCTEQRTGPVLESLKALQSGKYVVFVNTGQLESAPDMEAMLTELQRVSGGDLFIAHKEPFSFSALIAKRLVLTAPPKTPYTQWKNLPWTAGSHKTERLGALRRVS